MATIPTIVSALNTFNFLMVSLGHRLLFTLDCGLLGYDAE
jgi:hypothetical protein